MGLCDVNEDSYIFIYSNSEITTLETSFQLCKKPPKKKKLHLCIISPWWISTQQIQGRKAKRWANFWHLCWTFFSGCRGARATAQPETSISAWMALSQSKPPEMEANKVNIPLLVCLFVCLFWGEEGVEGR